jgi:hypothetical protein
VGEEARCTGVDERKKGEMRDGVGQRLLWRLSGAGGEEKGRGVRLGAAWGQEKERRGGGGLASWTSTDTAAPVRFDSGVWRMPHGCDGRGCDRGGRWGVVMRARRLTGGAG